MQRIDHAIELHGGWSLQSSAREAPILVRLKSGNRLTLPKAVTNAVDATDYFDVTAENGRIVLTPVQLNRADAVRLKVAEAGLTESDVSDAISWARPDGQHRLA